MANYICAGRTNYFEVADEEAFDTWLSHVCEVEKFEETEEDGTRLFGFGCYGTPWYDGGDNNEGEYGDGGIDCDASIKEIQSFLAEGQAFIYMEAGWEKLRYVSGWSLVVTKDAVDYVSIVGGSVDAARKLLGDESYSPQMDY